MDNLKENLTEILELSKWLHEKGFEPDAWWNSGSIVILECFTKEEQEETFTEMKEGLVTPYFTLERCLELLPEKIVHPYMDKGLTHFKLIYFNKRFNYIYEDVGKLSRFALFELGDSRGHLAALRLLKQVVEKGYIKGNKNK